MGKIIFLTTAAVLLALATQAGAQTAGADPTPDGIARSASLMREIGAACPPLMDVNVDLAGRYQRAFVETGEQAFGKEAFQKKLEAEYLRRAAEVKQKTPESWCLDQRARLRDMGGADLFRK